MSWVFFAQLFIGMASGEAWMYDTANGTKIQKICLSATINDPFLKLCCCDNIARFANPPEKSNKQWPNNKHTSHY
jgi:hypothetical protein